ncbi:MAG: hypothetical protein ABI361_08315 [Nitrososphaera sp.]
MSEPVILNWERVMHKNVRSSDGVDAGNIIAESGETFTILSGASREYRVPKDFVEGFNGSEVTLSLTYNYMLKFKVS